MELVHRVTWFDPVAIQSKANINFGEKKGQRKKGREKKGTRTVWRPFGPISLKVVESR
jgi:hypothetical protein